MSDILAILSVRQLYIFHCSTNFLYRLQLCMWHSIDLNWRTVHFLIFIKMNTTRDVIVLSSRLPHLTTSVVRCVNMCWPGLGISTTYIYKHINNSAGCDLSRLDYGHDSSRYDFSLQIPHREVMIINIPSCVVLSHEPVHSLSNKQTFLSSRKTGKLKYKNLCASFLSV